MLLSLHIENLAVIKCIDVDFSQGFMALTGETGAGKSIIIDSIHILLGGRADRDLIRTGENCAMVSGVFANLSDNTLKALLELGVSVDEEGMLLVQRTISLASSSTVKINGRTVSLSVLKSISPLLVAIHGQSDTAALADARNQLDLVDVYASSALLMRDYTVAYEKLELIRTEIV